MAFVETDPDGNPTYAFKPSLLGASSVFTLEPGALVWEAGRRGGRIPYDRIRFVRLSYRPVSMQSHRFIAEIWSADGQKVQIASVSWRTMVEQQRLDLSYALFVAELHRRIAASGAPVRFSSGVPAVTYWLGVVVFAAVIVATAVLLLRSMLAMQWAVAAIVAAFMAVFAYQIGNYLFRNRPRRYRPDAIPPGVLPKADG